VCRPVWRCGARECDAATGRLERAKERSRFRRIAGKVFIPVIRAFRQISIHLNSDGRAPRDMKHAKNRADAPAFVGSA